jgi:3-phosphoshikimate 1-carboxyvinyltransferase
LRAGLSVPGDKSIGHRGLLFGALAEGELRIRNLPDGRDVRSTRRCLEALGAVIKEDGQDILVQGNGGALRPPRGPLDCGNSGTTMRLLMGALAGQPFACLLNGDASLSRRPMGRVAEPLRQMGAAVELTGGSFAPVRVSGRRPLTRLNYRLPVPSAQVKSALLLAGMFADGESVTEDPFRTRDHSERMLAWLGACLRVEGERIHVSPGPLRSGRGLTVPGDASAAAFFLAAGAIVPSSKLTIRGVGINPTRMGFVDALREMGAPISVVERGSSGGEPVGDLHVEHGPLRGIRVPAARIPALIDEVPLLAVVAASARGQTRIEGLAELRHKESDRLEGTAACLRAMGAQAEVDGDALTVRGPARLKGARVQTLGDHRLAMALAVAALVAEGQTELSDAECAAISYPRFFEDLAGL